jgi:sulfate adenylyltransferase subunit 1 (EFTu-like GTPase family)
MMYLNPSNELKLNINNMGVHNQMYAVIQLNNIGCIHLKMKKPVLAVYYLSRALEVHINK